MAPLWDLDIVLRALYQPPFEPLPQGSFMAMSKKKLFLIALAIAKRVRELQALSKVISFRGADAFLQ